MSSLRSRTMRALAVAVMFVTLAIGTVLAFAVFDRDSHSASDTIRPFLITVVPLWIVAIAAVRLLLGRAGGR